MATARYEYTVPELMKAAGADRTPHSSKREGYEVDHVIDLQLVTTALNRLSANAYTRPGWQKDLVEFFNGTHNMKEISEADHDKKSLATMRLARGAIDTEEELDQARPYILQLRKDWSAMKGDLPGGFGKFRKSMDAVLNTEFTMKNGKTFKI